jgi:hypothetical protein
MFTRITNTMRLWIKTKYKPVAIDQSYRPTFYVSASSPGSGSVQAGCNRDYGGIETGKLEEGINPGVELSTRIRLYLCGISREETDAHGKKGDTPVRGKGNWVIGSRPVDTWGH